MISHVVGHDSLVLNFGVDYTCMISHVIVLSKLHHGPYHVGLVMIVQFHFRQTADLYDRSHPCPISSSS